MDKAALLESVVLQSLSASSSVTSESIRDMVAEFASIPTFSCDADTLELVARRIEEKRQVTMDDGSYLHETTWQPWLATARIEVASLSESYYWHRYADHLRNIGLPPTVVAQTDSITERTLDLLQNPEKQGSWDRRGLVVGHVQSGKTANYLGLVCKAADAGFKVIIIVAGIHNNLRNQTQRRVDEGFIGRDSLNPSRFIGVGLLDGRHQPNSLTSASRDFSRSVSPDLSLPLKNLKEPAVFVVKKNAGTLRHLKDWLRDHNAKPGGETVEYPLLLIDDEADNASINTKSGSSDASTINSLLREILGMFPRSAYVGYTATPFANIFIDPDSTSSMLKDDLFPRDFIVSLDPPSNYFGPDKVFLNEEESTSPLVEINDADDILPPKHQKDHRVTELPESLKDAMRTFVIARAIRLARGDGHQHASMLVNASRFTNVQRELRNTIHLHLQELKDSLRINGNKLASRALTDPIIADLQNTWSEQYEGRVPESWLSIFQYLHDAAAPIQTIEINSGSSARLNYHEYPGGLSVIAVGGYSLSRGLTLEGLVVSYYLRNSVMYDTLMQMGRWFGYRPGYEELCRIWMSPESIGWYQHVSESLVELRDDLRRMEVAGATPEEFGLRVRSHPDTLMVTARNKMGSSQKVTVDVRLSDRLVESTVVYSARHLVDHNLDAGAALVKLLEADVAEERITSQTWRNSGTLYRRVPANLVLTFLRQFQNHPQSPLSDPAGLTRYISARDEHELAHWDVFLPSTLMGSDSSRLGPGIRRQQRRLGKESRSRHDAVFIGDRRRVSSRGIESVGLPPELTASLEGEYREAQMRAGRSSANIPDKVYRKGRIFQPLLALHLLELTGLESMRPFSVSFPSEVLAFSMSLPETKLEDKGTAYQVNTTYFKDMYLDSNADDEREDG